MIQETLQMSDGLVPEWIKKIKAQQDQDRAAQEVESQEAAFLAKAIRADSTDFWKALLKALHFTVASLDQIGVKGTISTIASAAPAEGLHISVTKSGPYPVRTYTNVFFDGPESPGIRCHPHDGSRYDLSFCLSDTGVLMVYDDEIGERISAERSAQRIVQPMVEGGDHSREPAH